MGDLPEPRVNFSRPFSTTGMDFCGPFTSKSDNLRSSKCFKTYVCVFICFVTKAVHLEVVSDFSTPAFLAALTRFVSRRGLPSRLYSDCGTNFVGADTHIKRTINNFFQDSTNQDILSDYATTKGFEFCFIPPAAPHQGGLWESAVKSFKHHLIRVIGTEVLTVEEFFTVSTKIEAILNSRPITPLSSDPSDLTALTPGHFLIGSSLFAVPEEDFAQTPISRLKRWQRLQSFTQNLWQRWSKEYLHTLQQRSKWLHKGQNLKVGDLVILQDTKTTPLCWPLARITAIHPGSDQIVRVVTLQTKNGTFTRPAVKVFPLPQLD
jgi:hypothetical protein